MDHELLARRAGAPVLVTGASGFLGSRLAATLCGCGLRVRALLRPTSELTRLAGLRLEIVRGELGAPAVLAAAVAGQQLVFHCAARVSDWGAPDEFHGANVVGTRNVARACLHAGVQRLVHVSSLSVLGLPRDGRCVDEQTPTATPAGDLYTQTKIAAEREVCELVDRGLAACIVRPGAIWGPGEANQLPRLERLLRARLLPLIDGGRNHVALSHVRNVVQGMILAALSPAASGQIYHLTDGEDLTAREVIEGFARAFGVPPPRLSLPLRPLLALGALSEGVARALGTRRAPALTRYGVRVVASDCRYDIGKARRELGYAPTTTFGDGLAELAALRAIAKAGAADENRRA